MPITLSSREPWFCLIAGVCGLAVACSHPPGSPVAPAAALRASAAMGYDGIGGSDEVGFDPHGAAKASAGGTASGHAEVRGTPVQNVLEQRYSFTALPDGVAPGGKGEASVHYVRFTGEKIDAHAAITCVSVEGNQAWVGARVERFVVNGEELTVDLRMIFRVQDGGEGAGSTDLASLVFFGPPGLDLAHCSSRQAFPGLRATTTGNIQVKPE